MIKALALALTLAGAANAAPCRQALVLGLDVSGSVDAHEYRLQLNGIASALSNPSVRDAFLSTQSAFVSVLIYEWSGPVDQRILVPWSDITRSATLDEVIDRLVATSRRDASPGTALGAAMAQGVQHLSQRSDCSKRTLDISGDGKSNLGPRPRDVKNHISDMGVTVNALVVTLNSPRVSVGSQAGNDALTTYFKAEVITGADAFVETATGYADYEAAMIRKLLRELAGQSVAQLAEGQR